MTPQPTARATFTSPSAPQPMYTDPLQPNPKGMVRQGNIDLTKLPVVYTPDGGWGTIKSSSFDMGDGKETLVPTILNGKPAPDDEEEANRAAIAEYHRTGRHLGVFDNPDTADAYAQSIHENWEAGRIPGLAMPDQQRLLSTKYFRDNGYLDTALPQSQSQAPVPYRVRR